IVLTDRSKRSQERDGGIYSDKIWRLEDLSAKCAFLRAGLGFGRVPLFLVEEDLAAGRLRNIRIATAEASSMSMHAIYRKATPPGPAGRWLIERLKRGAEDAVSVID